LNAIGYVRGAVLGYALMMMHAPVWGDLLQTAFACAVPFEVAPNVTVGVRRLSAIEGEGTAAAPIYFIAGGPGVSGMEELERRPALFARLRALGEVVIVEQRGAGYVLPSSNCAVRWNLPLDQPVARDAWVAHARERFVECAQELRSHGTDLTQWRTPVYAQDLIAVMRALNHRRVRLYAHSYGTMIAFEVLRQEPERVERAVLAGIMGPGDALRDPAHHERVLATAAHMLKLAPRDLYQRAAAALDAVVRQPLSARTSNQESIVLGRDDVARALVQTLGRPGEIARLPALLDAITRGKAAELHGGWLRGAADSALQQRRGPLHRRAAAQHYATVCSGGEAADHKARREAAMHSGLFGHVLHSMLPEACDGLGITPGIEPPAPVRSRVSVMLVSALLDVRTPHEQAQLAAHYLPNSVMLTLLNAGHGELLAEDSQLIDAVNSFLRGGEVQSQSLALQTAVMSPE
jgi:pimeloyl-ACP methyl ester carboxylesterase